MDEPKKPKVRRKPPELLLDCAVEIRIDYSGVYAAKAQARARNMSVSSYIRDLLQSDCAELLATNKLMQDKEGWKVRRGRNWELVEKPKITKKDKP